VRGAPRARHDRARRRRALRIPRLARRPDHWRGRSPRAAALWHPVPFDDIAALESAVQQFRPAAIVLEPVVERAPVSAWLRAARSAADASGAALIFDEIKDCVQAGAGRRRGALRRAPGPRGARQGRSPTASRSRPSSAGRT